MLVMKQERKGSAGRGQETPAESKKEVTKQAEQETKQEAKHKRFDLAFHLAALRDKIASRHRRQKVRRAIPAQKTQLLEKLPLSVCFSPFLLLSKQFKKDEKMSKCRRPVIHPA